ncbi:MAG: hypothetical protein WCT53_00645 [Candidatus Gracilibacteria bacterium]|jgi:hypothetical protein
MKSHEDIFEKAFSYISDRVLRKHMCDALRGASELATISTKYPQPLKSVLLKTSIIYLGSIIEAALHFCVLKMGFKDYGAEWSYKDCKVIYEITETASQPFIQVVAGKRFKKKEKIDSFIDFAILNRLCRDEAKIYDGSLYEEIDKVRRLRNKIHLMKLSNLDRKYTVQQLNSVGNIAVKVLEIVENKLKECEAK